MQHHDPAGLRQRPRARQEGSLVIELVFVLPVLLLIVFISIEMSRMVWCYATLMHATREGARFALVRGQDSPAPASLEDIRQKVLFYSVGLDTGRLVVDVLPAWPAGSSPGAVFRVQASYEFVFVWPSIVSLSAVQMQASSEMSVSQ